MWFLAPLPEFPEMQDVAWNCGPYSIKHILGTVYRMNTQEYMEIQMYQNDPKRHIKHTLQKHTIHTSHVLFQKLVENLTWVRLGLQSGVG